MPHIFGRIWRCVLAQVFPPHHRKTDIVRCQIIARRMADDAGRPALVHTCENMWGAYSATTARSRFAGKIGALTTSGSSVLCGHNSWARRRRTASPNFNSSANKLKFCLVCAGACRSFRTLVCAYCMISILFPLRSGSRAHLYYCTMCHRWVWGGSILFRSRNTRQPASDVAMCCSGTAFERR